jgi:methylated-DNA-[protein]-cysteine S-methyltransferase
MVTKFQQTVYDALKKVPKGKVTTYKLLAITIKCNSSQAVGQALKVNPFAPHVPCHRVIKSDLTIGGFSGKTTGRLIKKKLKLLEEEGVKFSGNKLADTSKVWPK